jgi:AraC-like DNA-binding protein
VLREFEATSARAARLLVRDRYSVLRCTTTLAADVGKRPNGDGMGFLAPELLTAHPQSAPYREPAVINQHLSPDSIAERDRFPFWKEAVCDSVAGVDIRRRDDAPVRGELQSRSVDLGGAQRALFIDISSVAQSAWHHPRHVANEAGAWLNLVLAKEGQANSTQFGESVLLQPGDMILKDLTRPSGIQFDRPYRHFVLKFPRTRIAGRQPQGSLWPVRPVRSASPLGSVLAADLAALSNAVDAVDAASLPHLIDRTIDLIALTFVGDVRKFAGCGSTVRRALVMRAVLFIDRHLCDPALATAGIAAALGISASYLQHLFQAAGMTVNGCVRRRRLERCRDDLADPLRMGDQIAEIAARWGFRDMPWFSRAFRREFGMTAGEYRALCRQR